MGVVGARVELVGGAFRFDAKDTAYGRTGGQASGSQEWKGLVWPRFLWQQLTTAV